MAVAIENLRGINSGIASKLKEKGINNSDQLLAAAKTPAQRKTLSADCGCAARDILELANRADLNRISGIGGVYSDLMEKAGVDTVTELAQRRADNLHKKMEEVNDGDAKQVPAAKAVEDWVAQAKKLDRAIEY